MVAQRTDTVADLKAVIAKTSSSAPQPDLQRLLLKGKALTDAKLLKEYDIDDGATVHLLLKPNAPAVAVDTPQPSTSTSHARTPSLTITTAIATDAGSTASVPVTDADIDVPPLGPQPQVSSAAFHNTIADTSFWQKMHALCITEFAIQDDADSAWDVFLLSMKGRLSAGEAAKIRDVVGIKGAALLCTLTTNSLTLLCVIQGWAAVRCRMSTSLFRNRIDKQALHTEHLHLT